MLYKEPWTGRAVNHFTLDMAQSTSPGRAIRTGRIRSDEGLTFETSAFESLYEG